MGAKAKVVWVCVEYRIEGKGERGGERRLSLKKLKIIFILKIYLL